MYILFVFGYLCWTKLTTLLFSPRQTLLSYLIVSYRIVCSCVVHFSHNSSTL